MTYPWELKTDDYAGFYASMPDDELIIWLRYYFIKKNAPSRLIERFDEIETGRVAENKLAEAYDEGFADGEEAKEVELSVGNNNQATT